MQKTFKVFIVETKLWPFQALIALGIPESPHIHKRTPVSVEKETKAAGGVQEGNEEVPSQRDSDKQALELSLAQLSE